MSDSSGQRKLPPPPPSSSRKTGEHRLPPPPTRNPEPEGRAKTLQEAMGKEGYSNLVKAVRMIEASCPQVGRGSIGVSGMGIIHSGREISSFSGGSASLPLSAFGDERHVYACIYERISSGELPAPSLIGQPSIPEGLFIRVSSSGIELCFSGAPSRKGPENPALSRVFSLLASLDSGLDANSIPVSGSESEKRIYFSDLGWGEKKYEMCGMIFKALNASTSEARLLFLSASREVFLLVQGNSVSLCGARGKGEAPSVSIMCAQAA